MKTGHSRRPRWIGVGLALAAMIATTCVVTTGAAQAESGADSGQRMRVVTANLDWSLSQRKVHADLNAIKPEADVILMQEARNVRLNKMFNDRWSVYQDRSGTTAKRNVGIALRKSALADHTKPFYKLGVRSNGAKFYTRWIMGANLTLKNGARMQVDTVHFPVKKWTDRRETMADNVTGHLRKTKLPTVIGGDWNARIKQDPFNIGERSRMRPHGKGIDGFLVDQPAIDFKRVARMPQGNSDHHAVRMVIQVG